MIKFLKKLLRLNSPQKTSSDSKKVVSKKPLKSTATKTETKKSLTKVA